MKETNVEDKGDELIKEDLKNPPLIQKYSSESQLAAFDEDDIREKEIRKSNLFNFKDYLFFCALMISSSMNFSILYFPFIIVGIFSNVLISTNSLIKKPYKFYLELCTMIYAALLLIFKIICLVLIHNDNTYISEHSDIFLNLGICYLRKDHTYFYFIMTFLGEIIVILFSIFSIIVTKKCSNIKPENDVSSIKNKFWNSRNLILLNYIFLCSFATFNVSFSTVIYMFLIQLLFFLSSIRENPKALEQMLKIILIILKYCILVQIVLINIFNLPSLQENVLHADDIKDKDGYVKVYSIYTQIGINYAFNESLTYVWKEWIGYLAAICSLISLTYSINNIRANREPILLKKSSTLPFKSQSSIEIEEPINNINNLDEKPIKIKRKESKAISCIKKTFGVIINFITSSVFIIQFCRVMSIFYMYLYPNFYSIGIFLPLFFSSIFIDIKMNKKWTTFLLTPSLMLTQFSYHMGNVNGFFENYNDERRRKYLNFALGKYEYSFLEGYGHNLFFIFVMFLVYSFYPAEEKVILRRDNSGENDLIINEDPAEPLLNEKVIDINDGGDDIIIPKPKNDLNLFNLFLKFIFTHIDKITLIAMYFVSMRSINLIHLVLVVIFLIQILLPNQIKKMFKVIICILQILFLIELIIYLLKAYFYDTFNKGFMNFISKYSDKVTDKDMELSIYIVLYCFYFQYQFDNFPYLKAIMNNKKINLEKYVDQKFKKLPKTKYFLNTLGIIISNFYIWILIGLFFVVSCYFEINLIFAIKLGYFLLLCFLVLLKIQNPEKGNKFSPVIHYIFLIFCSLNSLLVYIYQFKDDEFLSSNIDFTSDNFFSKNLPNIGFSIYLKNNLYLNFLPHFGITFISVLFISEIQRQLKKLVKKKFISHKTMNLLDKKKNEIDIELADETLSDEARGILKAQKFEENAKVLKHLSIKYFFVNLMKIFTAFYWLFLFLAIGIIFSFYDLSFSMTIYIIIFSVNFILNFYRRITKMTAYIKKPSYFVSKVIRYTIVEQPLSIQLKKYYRDVAFKYLLAYNFIFFIFLYLYGVFDLFQHGCNDEFFKGCEKSNDPIFTPDGTVENYIKAFSYLFGIYVDIRNEGLIKTAWVHILLTLLIGFDIYTQKLENKYVEQSKYIRLNMLQITNENNTLFRFDKMRDTNILIKIGLKLAGIASSEEILEKRLDEIRKGDLEFEKDKKKKVQKEEIKEIKEKKEIEEKKEEVINTQIKTDNTNNNIIEIKTNEKDDGNINIEQKIIAAEKKKADDEKIMEVDVEEDSKDFDNAFLKEKIVKQFNDIFVKSYDNDQTLSDSNNNSTKLIWFLKKIFEELIIVILICIALTKLNLLSLFYFLCFAYLTITKKTMFKFYLLYCILLLLIVVQSIIYITNISADTSPRINLELLEILKELLSIPWYQNRLNIEKKYAFFYGFGVNKTQMGLLLLEYLQVIVLYIYLEFFSFSIYQDVVNRGEKESANSKFNFESVKLNGIMKREIKTMNNKLFTQYKECLINFNLNIGETLEEMKKNFDVIKEEKSMPAPNFKPNSTEVEKLIIKKNNYFQFRERMKREGRDNVPDSDFIRAFQEFIYLYLHIFILLLIIIISLMITGLISIFYLSICFYYLLNSQKIYLGLKYGYPKQIKKLLKIVLIVDIVVQLIYQIPYITSEEDSLFYKIFNALGFTKLLKYLENSDVELASSGIIEIIGKPLIYLFISLQTIIYNSKDFKKYYILFLLSIQFDMKKNGLVNTFIFNNLRIREFQNSVDLRLQSEQKMDEIKDHLKEWDEKLKMEGVNLFDEPKEGPLEHIKEKEKKMKLEEEKKKKEEEDKKKEEEIKEIEIKEEEKKEEEKKVEIIENKEEDIKNEEAPKVGLLSKLSKKMEEKKKEDNEQIIEEIQPRPSTGLSGLRAKMKAKKEKEKKDLKNADEEKNLLINIKEKGIHGLIAEVGKAKRLEELVEAEKIKSKIRDILLSGKLTKFYLWFNAKSIYFKSMEYDNKFNFEKECFVGNTITKSYLENEIDKMLKILDLSNFDAKEVEIIEDFFIKFKKGKLMKELDKIKKEIKEKKINKYMEINNDQEEDIINTNINNNNILNNNINRNDIDEKELEKIDVEFNIKKGLREINICEMKFKQFYYLLDTKLFRIYLQKSYLIKSILSKVESFIANNFDYFTYLIMIINHMNNCSLISMFYPISVFCYALLENPRPKKIYWLICLYYSSAVLILKFLFQLKLFNSIFDPETYSKYINYLYYYKVGIRYFNEGFGSKFFGYIALDSLLLLILSINKNVLISNGLWYRREEQIENIFLASERYAIFKDKEAERMGFGTMNAYRENKLLAPKEEQPKTKKIKKRKFRFIKKKEEEEKLIENNQINNILENKPDEIKKDDKDIKGQDNINNKKKEKDNKNAFIPEDIILYYEGMKDNPKYDEANKKYYEKLFPKIRNEKPGTNKYPFLALSLAIIIIYILIFFTQMAQDKTYGPVNLDTTQFSGSMVLFLIFHVVILVYDRILYISQNKSDLKYKYFIYKKDYYKKGIAISKEEFQNLKDNYYYFKNHNWFVQSLQKNNYNIFYIQTEPFNSPLLQKYILHILTTVICHGFAFFYFPMIGNYNLVNSIYCLEEEPELCNDFTKNNYVIVFYIFYLLYLYISSTQIKLGYHDIKRKSLFKRNTSVTNLMSKIFNAIPFLPQIRYVIDWTFTSTCFDLFQWIKFESIYDSIYDAYTDSNEDDDDPIGERVARKKKIGMGGVISFVLIFILIVPLVLFSSLNPTNKLNNLNGGKLNVDLSFIYGNDVELNYNLFENTRAKTIADMFKTDDDDSNWKKYKYDQSVQTRNFNHKQIQIIKFSETSDRNWDLAEPHINDLIDLLNITNNEGLESIKLKIHTEFDRDLPAEAQTVSHDFDVEIYSSNSGDSSEGAQKIYELRNALANCSRVEIELLKGYSSPLRITAAESITVIEDEKYISLKTVQLGFQGCEKEEKRTDNGTILVNTYLKSYFTFKSKDPEETEFTGAEFHAFNDMISETTSGYSVLTFYLTFILVAGSYVADFLASEPEKIMFTDLPHPEKIVNLCEGIQIARYSYDFKKEEYLYTILIELMRTPDYLKRLTDSSLKCFQKRRDNNAHKNEEEEEEKDEKDKKNADEDDGDDSLFKTEEEIKRRLDAEEERIANIRKKRAEGEQNKKKKFDKNFNNKKEKKEKPKENDNENNIDNIKEEKIELKEKDKNE